VAENGTRFSGFISNISPKGAFLETDEKLDLTQFYMIEFDFGPEHFSIHSALRWQNRRIRNNNQLGYGLEFSASQSGIARILKQTHLTINKKAEAKTKFLRTS
jgi:hypothetical protein